MTARDVLHAAEHMLAVCETAQERDAARRLVTLARNRCAAPDGDMDELQKQIYSSRELDRQGRLT